MNILNVLDRHFKYYELNKEYEQEFKLIRNPNENSNIRYMKGIQIPSPGSETTYELTNVNYWHIIRMPYERKHHSFIKLNTDQIKEAQKENRTLTYLLIFDDEPDHPYVWEFNNKEIAIEYTFNSSVKLEPFIKVFTKYFKDA